MSAILAYFNWNEVAIIFADEAYSSNSAKKLQTELASLSNPIGVSPATAFTERDLDSIEASIRQIENAGTTVIVSLVRLLLVQWVMVVVVLCW